jgi:transposase
MGLEKDNNTTFAQALLQERDELYRELSRLRSRVESYADIDQKIALYEKTINEKDVLIKQTEQVLKENVTLIAALRQQVQTLLRFKWGKSSERFIDPDPLQRKIDFEGLDELPEEAEQAKEAVEEIQEYKQITVPVKPKRKPVRAHLPEHLPRRDEHIYPRDIDRTSDAWLELAPIITEVLEHEPAQCYVRRIIRHVYALKDKKQEVEKEVVTAPAPVLPIAKSYAGASILAELMINKYVNHLPFYRQIHMFGQLGIPMAASTVNDWFRDTADLLRPLYYRLQETVLSSDYIQVDETTLPVVNDEKHKTVKGYIWMVRSVIQNRVFFHYDHGSRAQKVAIGLLKDFRGALQTDGYEVYAMYENKKGVLPIGCWAHVRRKFSESLKEDKARSEYALAQIGLLYDVERRADGEQLSYEERAELRTRLSYPIMCAFEGWIYKEIPKVVPKGRIGKALKYTYNIFHRLTRYHLDGRYEIDNNLAENAIRPIALGRKNFLFCKNHSAAEDAAVFYSLLGCCKAAEVNFRDWLIYVLNHIHEYDDDYNRDLSELLPDIWQSQHAQYSTSENN